MCVFFVSSCNKFSDVEPFCHWSSQNRRCGSIIGFNHQGRLCWLSCAGWRDLLNHTKLSTIQSRTPGEKGKKPCNIDLKISMKILFHWNLVCYTAIFSIIMQRSSPLTAAANRTTFLCLCVCGLTNQSCVRKLTKYEPQCARREHASQFATNQSIVAEFWWALCLQATKRLFAEKFVLGG